MFPPGSAHRHSFGSGLPDIDPGLFEIPDGFGLPGLDGREHEFHFGLLLVEGGEEVLVGELLFGLVVSVGVIGEGEDELGVVVFFQLPQLHVLKGVVLGGYELLLGFRALHVDS